MPSLHLKRVEWSLRESFWILVKPYVSWLSWRKLKGVWRDRVNWNRNLRNLHLVHWHLRNTDCRVIGKLGWHLSLGSDLGLLGVGVPVVRLGVLLVCWDALFYKRSSN